MRRRHWRGLICDSIARQAVCLVVSGICLFTGSLAAADNELPAAEGVRRYADLVHQHPQNASYQNALGYYYYRAGNLQEAEVHYLRAIQLDDSFATAHNNLGVLSLHQGKPEQAETHFRQAIKLDSHYTKAQYNLAVALFRQKRYTEAASAYFKAREMDRDYVSRRDDQDKMKRALSEAAREGLRTEELKRMMQRFAPSY
jgi:tetratricopeptide (TPR) repeat protein